MIDTEQQKYQTVDRKYEQIFHKEALYMTDKHMKRCLIPLVIREMQIKTMMMHDCTLIGTESIKK